MNRSRRAPLQHPLADLFGRAVEPLSVPLLLRRLDPVNTVARHATSCLSRRLTIPSNFSPTVTPGSTHPRLADQTAGADPSPGCQPPTSFAYLSPRHSPGAGLERHTFPTSPTAPCEHSLAPRTLAPRPSMRQDQSSSRNCSAAMTSRQRIPAASPTGMRIGEAADLSFDCLHTPARTLGDPWCRSAN